MTEYKSNYSNPVRVPTPGLRLEMGGGRPEQIQIMRLSPPIANSIDDVASHAEKLVQGRNYKTLNETELKKIEQYLTE